MNNGQVSSRESEENINSLTNGRRPKSFATPSLIVFCDLNFILQQLLRAMHALHSEHGPLDHTGYLVATLFTSITETLADKYDFILECTLDCTLTLTEPAL